LGWGAATSLFSMGIGKVFKFELMSKFNMAENIKTRSEMSMGMPEDGTKRITCVLLLSNVINTMKSISLV